MLEIPYYLELQRRLVDVFRYVSCHEKNFETHSVVLESLLVDACSFFDSLCQTFIREQSKTGLVLPNVSAVPDLQKKVSGSADFNFGDYRALLEDYLSLSQRKVNLNLYEGAFYSNPVHCLPDAVSGYEIVPFREWNVGGNSPWWRAFTDLKHDRINNFREAKLRHVLNALGAVFVVLTLQCESEFKAGSVPLEVYDLFFPKYWKFKGRVAVMNFMWE